MRTFAAAIIVPHSAHQTKEECEDTLARPADATNATWRCLPDTVDPRGSKGAR